MLSTSRHAPNWLPVALALAFLGGCGFPKSGQAPAAISAADVNTAKAKWPDASEEKLAQGRSVFLAKCNGCHGYPDLQSVEEAKWPGIIERMGKKADLDAPTAESVLRFVQTARAREHGSP